MLRITVLKPLGILAAIVLFLLTFAIALANNLHTPTGNIAFGGEDQDHFWNVTMQFCTNGFIITAQETNHPDNSTGDALPFSLQLGSSDPPIFQPIPAPIAGGFGGPNRTLASGQTVFLFTRPQPVGSAINITLERWDHGAFTAHETETDNSDHSIDFDDIWPFKYDPPPPPNLVQNCTVPIDRTPPTTTAVVSPPPGQNGINTTPVAVQFNATDNAGGQGAKMIEYWATGAQPINRTMYFGTSLSIPISAIGNTTLSYFAWDNAGNPELNSMEAPKSLTINIVSAADRGGAGHDIYLPLIIR